MQGVWSYKQQDHTGGMVMQEAWSYKRGGHTGGMVIQEAWCLLIRVDLLNLSLQI